jgi:hypothetical protein
VRVSVNDRKTAACLFFLFLVAGCEVHPKGATELVGTYRVSYTTSTGQSPVAHETLTLKPDGTLVQTIYITSSSETVTVDRTWQFNPGDSMVKFVGLGSFS